MRPLEEILQDKQKIDDLLEELSSGRLSFILHSNHVFKELVSYLREVENTELLIIVMKHRLYVEYKAKELLKNES